MATTATVDVYLFECSPFDPSAGATTTVRFGTHEWITGTGDTPANTTYRPGMQFSGFGSSILDSDGGMLGGFVELDSGQITIPVQIASDTASPADDDLALYAWSGYQFTIYKIAAGALYSAKTTYLKGFVTGSSQDEGTLTLTVTSLNSTLAQKQISETKFWGRKHGLKFVEMKVKYHQRELDFPCRHANQPIELPATLEAVKKALNQALAKKSQAQA